VAHYYFRAVTCVHGRLTTQRARWPERIARTLTQARRRDGTASRGKAVRVRPTALEETVAWHGCAVLSRGGVMRHREREHDGGLTDARKGGARIARLGSDLRREMEER
jgi:hypothetical protein